MQQLVAGAAQLGAAQGAAQLGAQLEPQTGAQQRGRQTRIFGQQSFGIRMRWHRGLQQLLQPVLQLLQPVATGAQHETGAGAAQAGAQVATGAAQLGAQAGAQAGAAHEGAQAGAAQLGAAEQQLPL